jgi:DNA-binding NarL/FixJ family response regulator
MRLTVLIADDHALMRDGLKALLASSHDLQVVGEASDGHRAVRAVFELQPDIVLMDIAMPEMNGIEAVRAICERSSEARVIVLSMHSDAEHVFRAFDAGACGYLLKEAAGTELHDAIRAVRGGRRYVSPALKALDVASMATEGRRGPLEALSTRERQVLQLAVEGRSSAEIATLVHLSPKTVETYRSRVMKKLGVPDLAALVKFALKHGLTPPD